MTSIRIFIGDISFEADLFDSKTAKMILKDMPIKGAANIWGQEIYFPIACSADPEFDAQDEVEVGTLAYWPPGQAFCIFFGPTPVSTSNKPRAYSPVNVIGKIQGDPALLNSVTQGDEIRIELV